MGELHEVTVPDFGAKDALSVAEIHVTAGETVWADDVLVTVESGKAAVDVQAPLDGVVIDVRVVRGDNVAVGHVVVTLRANAEQRAKPKPAAESKSAAPPRFSLFAAFSAVKQEDEELPDIECDMVVLGAGPGGYSAAFRAADLGMNTVLVEREPVMGGVCLNVGCIPSKALLHLATVMEEMGGLNDAGISFAAPQIDLAKLRAHKAKVVGRLTGGLAGMAKARRVRTLRGTGRFVDAHTLAVDLLSDHGLPAGRQLVRFKQCIVAAGSRPVHLPFLPRDERIVDSTGALELRFRPQKMLVLGGGIIGLEMATVYSALGARIDIAEMQEQLMPGPDRDLVAIWEQQNRHRFDLVMLKTRAAAVDARPDGLWVDFEGEHAPAGPQRYDMILQAVGRRPNGKELEADKAGVAVTDAGFIPVDSQMRTNIPHIFAVGDIIGMPMLAHKAVHQSHVAAEAAAGLPDEYDPSLIPGVAYTNPEVAWVGLSEDEARTKGLAVDVASFPWAASGRAIANGADYGMTKLLFDPASGLLLGGAIVGPSAGDMIGEIALAVAQKCDATAIGKAIHHPHPTLGETVGLAALTAHGSCTDLPPLQKNRRALAA